MKEIYAIPSTNMIHKGQRLTTSPIRSEMRQTRLPTLLTLNIVLELFPKATRQDKEIQGKLIKKEVVKCLT